MYARALIFVGAAHHRLGVVDAAVLLVTADDLREKCERAECSHRPVRTALFTPSRSHLDCDELAGADVRPFVDGR